MNDTKISFKLTFRNVQGYPKKDEISEKIVQNLFSPLSCFLKCQNWLISGLNHFGNQHNNQLKYFGVQFSFCVGKP